MPRLDADQLNRLIREQFPRHDPDHHVTVEKVSEDGIRLRQPPHPRNLRPGDTLSGPTLTWRAARAAPP